MSDSLAGRLAIKARQIRPGTAQAIAVQSGQLLQIVDLQGKQVAHMVAYVANQPAEYLSVATSRTLNNNLMVQLGQRLYSNLGTALLEVTADTVGRHDTLLVVDPRPGAEAPTVPEAAPALRTELGLAGIDTTTMPPPVNWFQNVSIQQRGELVLREPISEAGDDVRLTALADLVVGVEVAPGEGGDILLRIYREATAEPAADQAASDESAIDAPATVASADDAPPAAPVAAAVADQPEAQSNLDNDPDLPLEAAAAIVPPTDEAASESDAAATQDEAAPKVAAG